MHSKIRIVVIKKERFTLLILLFLISLVTFEPFFSKLESATDW